MKRTISILLIAALVLSLGAAALAVSADAGPVIRTSAQKFTVDGIRMSIPAYNIDGYNYVQLRGLAAALNGTKAKFTVEYQADRNQVTVQTGKDYAAPEEPNYVGPSITVDAQGRVTSGQRSTLEILVDDQLCSLEAWNIGGFNYFKLSDLQKLLGFGLGYDEPLNTVRLTGDGSAPSRMPMQAADYDAVFRRLSSGRGGYRYAAAGGMGVDVNTAVVTDDAAPMEMPTPAPAAAEESAMDVGASKSMPSEGGAEYSGTNVQVQGIDEGDIVKTDGKYIYVLNGSYTLTIIEALGDKSRVVSQTEIGISEYDDNEKQGYSSTSKYPREMFVADGRLAVISNYNSYHSYNDGEVWQWDEENYTCVDFYDVSDPARPELLSSEGQDGNLIGSRLVDGRLYLVTNYWVWDYDEDDPHTYVPILYRNGEEKIMPADSIYICGGDSARYVVAGYYDMEKGSLNEAKSLLGSGSEIYMSGPNLYILGARTDTDNLGTYRESVYNVTEYRTYTTTEILRFDLSGGLELAASGTVPGRFDSQFSADEKDGYLRIVTTRDESNYKVYVDESYDFQNYRWDESVSDNGLYVLDGDLNPVGSVTGLAEGEYVYSVRFDGDIAYFCTYRNVDPLFTVDLSDPTNPRVMNALKISGFSEYLHNWTDGKLFGFGHEADEETGWTEGIKMVMFNTADKFDVYAENVLTLDDDYSEALYNHRAFFIVPEKNIIGFLAEDTYYIYSYDEADGFRLNCSFDFEDNWWARGLYIGDWTYIVGENLLTAVDMNRWNAAGGLDISADEGVG